MSDSYRPRLSIEISQNQADELRRLIPHGLKNQLYLIITEDVIRLADKFGSQFIAAILARRIRLSDYVQGIPREEIPKEESNDLD